MKTIYIALAALIVLVPSCDTRNDFFTEKNEKLVLTVKNNNSVDVNGVFADTVKTSSTSTKPNAAFSLEILGNKMEKNVVVTTETSAGFRSFMVDKNSVEFGKKQSISDKKVLDIDINGFFSSKNGDNGYFLNEYKLSILDFFDNEASVKYRVYAFENRPPRVNFSIQQLGILSEYEYILDASASSDSDAKWGGKIVKYEYTVEGITIESTAPVVKWIFSGAGTYEVDLKVTDNDGDLKTSTRTIVIN